MGIEIERKFLIRDRSILDGSIGVPYRQGYLSQGYLSTDPDRTVRVRKTGERPYLTIKGRSEGAARMEFEYEIPADDAERLLGSCKRPLIEKTRHRIEHAGLTWEVDVFSGENAGLVLAEVELLSADAAVEIAEWAGEEVTSDSRFFNANLVEHPFSEWSTQRDDEATRG